MAPDHWQARLLGVQRELALIESPEARDKIRRAALAACRCGRNLGLALLFVVIYLVSVQIVRRQAWSFHPQHPDHNALILVQVFFLSVPVVVGVILVWALRCDVQRFVRAAVKSSGTPICVQCGYGLAGVDSNRCPECGAALKKTTVA